MSKVLVIASREYNAVVRSKAFIISIILLPVMMFATMLIAQLSAKTRDMKDLRIAVIDRTPGEQIFPQLQASLDARPSDQRFAIEKITPAQGDAAIGQQRFELSERVRRGELSGILEIGERVPMAVLAEDATDSPDDQVVRYSTNTPTAMAFREFAGKTINRIVRANRLAAANVPEMAAREIQSQVKVVNRGLLRKDASGAIIPGEADRDIVAFLVPFGLVFLMFIVVVVGAVPMLQGIVEEKQQRIAEVLLGSVSPFQLMAGKVMGLVATSFTLILVYLGGAYFTAHRAGFGEYLPTHVLVWFLLFQLLAVLMYGSLYIAIGAACTDTKEMQSLLMPVNLVMAIPLMLIMPILLSPRGMLAKSMTYFPPATPFVTIARLAVPPGISTFELLASIVIVLGTTIALVWASGRIFRVGILMQGKGANIGQLLKWIVSG